MRGEIFCEINDLPLETRQQGTGGKYVFLTDDSGVGESHEEPDISGYTVEKLNDLMVREIRSYVSSRIGGRRVAEAR